MSVLAFSLTVAASGAPGAGPALSAISLSSGHACVVTAGGGVKCWGSNDYGQLGNGVPRKCGPDVGRFCAAAFHRTPVDVVGLASGVESVAAGGTHTCALTRRGGVKCWGYNASGQLGNGAKLCTVAEKDTCAKYVSSKPVNVVGLKGGVKAIAVGEFHSCALTTRGGMKCWGLSKYGQLGTEASGSRGSSTPLVVDGLASGVSAIAAGSQSTCALTSGGAVKCWGLVTGGYTPLDVPGVASGATAISVGWSIETPDSANTHACAVTTGGVKCWGMNLAGELGDGSRVTNSSDAVDVVGLRTGVKAIAAGAEYSCAITHAGRVRCWGNWLAGRSRVPVDVPGLASEVTAIAAGAVHACALPRGGGARCWGSNQFGKLGSGSKTRSSSAPVDVDFAAKPSAKPKPPTPSRTLVGDFSGSVVFYMVDGSRRDTQFARLAVTSARPSKRAASVKWNYSAVPWNAGPVCTHYLDLTSAQLKTRESAFLVSAMTGSCIPNAQSYRIVSLDRQRVRIHLRYRDGLTASGVLRRK